MRGKKKEAVEERKEDLVKVKEEEHSKRREKGELQGIKVGLCRRGQGEF